MKYAIAVCVLSTLFLHAEDAKETKLSGSSTTTTPAMPPPRSDTMSYITIDPKSRAADLKEAFEYLRRERTSQKVSVHFSNQPAISNILDFTLMQNGTIILFRYNTTQGIKYMMTNIEDITGISAT